MIDLTGEKIGRWTVIKKLPKRNNQGRWECLCECGTVKDVGLISLTRKTGSVSRSCGCVGKQKKYKTKSTEHYRNLYNVWHTMLDRCYRKGSSDFHKYGGREISVEKRWHDFGHFYNDVIDTYKPGLTIERVDVNGNYGKKNCTWIPCEDQAKNRRTTVWVEGLCAKDWCAKNNVPYRKFLWMKNKNGLSISEIISRTKTN